MPQKNTERSFCKYSLCSSALAVALFAGNSANAGEVLDRVLTNGELVGGFVSGFPPFSYHDEAGELAGFDVDVFVEIAGRLGVTPRIVEPSWDAMVGPDWQGNWDIVVNSVTPTASRDEYLDFPAIYYYTPAAFVVRVDNMSVTGLEDLNGRNIGTIENSSYENYLNHHLNINVVGMPPIAFQIDPGAIALYQTDNEAFDALTQVDGVEIEAVLSNVRSILGAITSGAPLRVIGEPVFLEPLGVAIDDNDPEFGARIAEIVTAMHTDGTLTRMSFEWFETDLTTP